MSEEDTQKKINDMYSIGKFAAICKLNTKTLRYYDDLCILKPRLRDPETNYRYYSHDQISEALFFKQLKSLNFPLEKIGVLIDSNRQREEVQLELKKRLMDLRREINGLQAKFDQTMDILMRVVQCQNSDADVNENLNHFCLMTYPRRTIVYSRYVSYWRADRLFSERRAELIGIAEQSALPVSGAMTAIFRGDYLAQFSPLPENLYGDLEVFYTIPDISTANEHCRLLGPFKCVSGVYTGDYSTMKPFYMQLQRWAAQQGLELSTCSLEEYVISSMMVGDPSEYTTKVYLPLRGSIV